MSDLGGRPPKRPRKVAALVAWIAQAKESGKFSSYQNAILHDWLGTLTFLAVGLVPVFFLLDTVMMPPALLPRFALYRLASTLMALVQAVIVRNSQPGPRSYIHGYILSAQVGGIIALMTTNLGGFSSSYYAGLNLVIIGVNLLMPWRAIHTAINSALIILFYISFNLIAGFSIHTTGFTNNLFFLSASAILAVSINHVRYKLISQEFSLLMELKKARDALWGEMELAKRIQTALLPQNPTLRGFDIAVEMVPAKEVGGDYYDIIETEAGERWVTIGDVAGHGVDSGIIMMMAQTCIMTAIKGKPGIDPVALLDTANRVIREDIKRLGSNHYMTAMAIRLEDNRLCIAGHHQDLLLYRSKDRSVSAIESQGTWLGITDDIGPFLKKRGLALSDGDAVLLFTDGASEATNASGEMYGQTRLLESFARFADLPAEEAVKRIMADIHEHQAELDDDLTLIMLKKKKASDPDRRNETMAAPKAIRLERTRLIYHLRVFNAENGAFIGHMVNITPKGMMVISKECLPRGMAYSLRMDLPRNVMDDSQLEMTAESTWCRPDSGGSFHKIGFRFLEVSPGGIELVDRLVTDFYREAGEEVPYEDLTI